MFIDKKRFSVCRRAFANSRSQLRLLPAFGLLLLSACSSNHTPAPPSDQVTRHIGDWRAIEDLPKDIAQFETVFWEPLDTPSLRKLIRESNVVKGRRVLEIGTGTGLLSLCALQAGARSVVATDINSNAVINARFNAKLLGFGNRLDVRLVPLDRSGAYEVIKPGERFDVIISNPPWVNRVPERIQDFALYDASFHLMQTLLDGLPKHLCPGGRVLLAYGAVSGIKTLQAQCAARGYSIRAIDDERDLDKLDEEFLPGMLFEVAVPVLRK